MSGTRRRAGSVRSGGSRVLPRLVAGALFVGTMVAIGAVAAWPIYRSWWYLLLVAVAALVATALVGVARVRRWGGSTTAGAAAVAFVLLGVPLAVPSRLDGPADILGGLRDVGLGLVLGWKDLVTVDLPVGTYRNLLVPALVVFLLGTCAALVLSWREDRVAYAAAPVALGMVSFGLLFGRSVTSGALSLGPLTLFAPVETAIGIAALVATLMWLAWRSREERLRALQRAAASSGVRLSRFRNSADRRRIALGGVMLSVAVVLAAVVVPFAARGAERDVFRSAVGPEIDLAAEVSPLSSYRSLFADDHADDVLFTIDVESGSPSRVRLATLDSYDGEVYRAGGGDSVDQAQFVRVAATLDAGEGRLVRARVVVDSLQGIWMPTIGRLSAVDFAGQRADALADSFYYNAAAAAGVQTAGDGLRAGDAYVIQAVEPDIPDVPSIEAPGAVESSPAAPESLTTWVERHATGSGGAALTGLVRLLRERSYLSHGLPTDGTTPVWAESIPGYAFQPSASGHSLARIDRVFSRMLAKETDASAAASGNYVASAADDEQLAVAVALVARELGFPSRVVVGARLKSADPELPTCEEGVCRAQDIAAWTEVQDEAGRWVPIDVTPQFEQSPNLQTTEQRDPENVTEIRPDSAEEVPPPDPVQDDSAAGDEPQRDAALDLAWLWPLLRAGGIVATILVLALGPFVAVIVAKATRRRARRTQRVPAARVAGGWDEYVDAGLDAGRRSPPSTTRTELADGYGTRSGRTLAAQADHAVFSGVATTEDEADRFWRIVDEERRLLAREAGFWHRLVRTVSLRSFIRPLVPTTGRREGIAERGRRRSVKRARTSP